MGRGISRGSSPDASQSGAQPRMRHGPICNAWPSPPRGRKNERQLQRMGRNLGTGRLCGPIVVVRRNFYPRKFVQPESCLSLVLRLCIFFPLSLYFFVSLFLVPSRSRGEDIRKILWGEGILKLIEKSRSRNWEERRIVEVVGENFLAFLDLFATRYIYFRREGMKNKCWEKGGARKNGTLVY